MVDLLKKVQPKNPSTPKAFLNPSIRQNVEPIRKKTVLCSTNNDPPSSKIQVVRWAYVGGTEEFSC